MAADPYAVLGTRRYINLLVFSALIGIPIAATAYYFLQLIEHTHEWVFSDLPGGLGLNGEPTWWPVVPLLVAGLVVGATIRYLPGGGGHSPADGFTAGAPPAPIELPGIVLAALGSLGLGAVVGPEAPLIALGGGIAALVVRLVKRDATAQTLLVVGAAGSFAAVAALLGSPLLGAFLLMEAIGLGGPAATVVLVPGLLAAGIGALVFLGIGTTAGVGNFSLAVPNLPPFDRLSGAEFAWAVAIGVAAAFVGTAIRWLAVYLRPIIERRVMLLTPVAGVVIALLAIVYAQATGKTTADVIFSGETALPGLVQQHADYTVGALVLLMVCKGLAYGISLSCFRGGPVFPGMFIGAAGGIAMSHLPGLGLVPAIAMGIGAMAVVLLRLPLTSVLLATLLLGSAGLGAMPVVIVAVVVAFVVSSWIVPHPAPPPEHAGTATTTSPAPVSAPPDPMPMA